MLGKALGYGIMANGGLGFFITGKSAFDGTIDIFSGLIGLGLFFGMIVVGKSLYGEALRISCEA